MLASVTNSTRTTSNVLIKVTENGYFTGKVDSIMEYGLNSVKLREKMITTTFTISNILKISIISSVSNSIGIGSRFKLYKLIAEPLADITVTSDTTEVDITV